MLWRGTVSRFVHGYKYLSRQLIPAGTQEQVSTHRIDKKHNYFGSTVPQHLNMKLLAAFAVLALLCMTSAETAAADTIPALSRQGGISITLRRRKFRDCPPKRIVRIRFETTYTFTTAGFSAECLVPRKCFPTKKAKKVSQKEAACVRKTVGRRCNPAAANANKLECIKAQVKACAPLAASVCGFGP